MNKSINIILPEKTVSALDRVTTKGNRSRFIDRAVLYYIESRGQQSLREKFAAGYRANAERDLVIAAEWFPIEDEALRTSENGARRSVRKPARSKSA